MTGRFDPTVYRATKLYPDRHDMRVVKDIIQELANPENLALWKEGVARPNFEATGDGYSHFQGFRQLMVDRAIHEDKGEQDSFFANDIEAILSPQRVMAFIEQLDGIRPGLSTDPDNQVQTLREHQAVHFISEGFTACRAARKKLSSPSP